MRTMMRDSLRHVAAVLIAIVLGMVLCWLLSGCKTIEVREVPVVAEHTTVQRHTDIVRDTLLMRDSVFHYVQGDTVLIERWHHTVKVERQLVGDTIHDTVPKVVTVTKTVTKVKPAAFSWWGILVIMICFFIVMYLCKRKQQ